MRANRRRQFILYPATSLRLFVMVVYKDEYTFIEYCTRTCTHTHTHMGTPFFRDAEDVLIRFALTAMMFFAFFSGFSLIDLYERHEKRFNVITRRIKGMPTVLMIHLIWTLVYFLAGWSYYVFFYNSPFDTGSSYVFDTITFLLIANVVWNRMYIYVLLEAQLTLVALLMLVAVDAVVLAMIIILGLNGNTTSMGLLIPYLIWSLYLTYINIAWLIVEASPA